MFYSFGKYMWDEIKKNNGWEDEKGSDHPQLPIW